MGLKALLVERPCWRPIKHSAFKVETVSGGWTPLDWVTYFEQKGPRGLCRRFVGQRFYLDEKAKECLLSSCFEPTFGVTTEFVVIKGRVFNGRERQTSKIRERAYGRGLGPPSLEEACLLRQVLSDRDLKEMGFEGIIVMHQPFADRSLLGVDQYGLGHRLAVHTDLGEKPWVRELGFAFVKHRSPVV